MLPLKNKTVLITRSANQVAEFLNQLNNLGAKTITLPLISNNAINQNELEGKVNNFNYDWIIFTSANAVRFFFKTVSKEAINSKIAVVGNKTEQVLREFGITANFTPSEYTAKHLANEIPVSNGQRILIPRSNLAKNDIVKILESRNCIVHTISIYANSPISYTKEKLSATFNQKIDFITFTSGSTVKAFMKLGVNIAQEKVICIGPETAKIAESNNLNVAAIATPHTIEGMIEAILKN